jgi:transcriptional regulator
MYVPKFNEEKNILVLHALIKSKPLGAWTTTQDADLAVNHLPFLLHENEGDYGTLYGHVARSNDIWRSFSKQINSIVIFQGDQAYITPSWYPSKHIDGKAVPTWNYTVVHAHGVPKIHEDAEWLLKHLNELTNTHESEQPLPWQVSDAPSDFINKLTKGIVGIEIPITKLVGKWKLGQNKSEEDKLGTVSGLRSRSDSESLALADELKNRI